MTTEIRVRTRIHPDTLESLKGKVLTESDLDVKLTGKTKVIGPDGKLLAFYLPGYFEPEPLDAFYPALHALRNHETDNRGLAAGTGRSEKLVAADGTKTRTRTEPVASAIIGAFDANPHRQYCRLTAWTGRETEQFQSLWPLFEQIGDAFAEEVPDRFQAQQAFVRRTPTDWVVPGTPFTTITVNNSYPTGVHTDKGDLDEGFSNLTVLRRGKYHGGTFTFPEYRVGVDMQDGDLLLMDAHQWHGNTEMYCDSCGQRIGPPNDKHAHDKCGDEFPQGFVSEGTLDARKVMPPERISIVCYYRTKMADCGTAEEEAQRAIAAVNRRIDNGSAVEEMAAESLG
jgi:hypothetical protein